MSPGRNRRFGDDLEGPVWIFSMKSSEIENTPKGKQINAPCQDSIVFFRVSHVYFRSKLHDVCSFLQIYRYSNMGKYECSSCGGAGDNLGTQGLLGMGSEGGRRDVEYTWAFEVTVAIASERSTSFCVAGTLDWSAASEGAATLNTEP